MFDLFEKLRSLDAGQIAYLSNTHVQDINNNNLLALGVGKLGTIRSKITSDAYQRSRNPYTVVNAAGREDISLRKITAYRQWIFISV